MNVVGLDLSLTATGICTDRTTEVLSSRRRGMMRLDDLRNLIVANINVDDLVVVEGYSYASHNQAHQLGELGGLIRWSLWGLHIHYVEVPPATLKKFATGKGNAGKPDMLAAAIRSGYDGPTDDNCVDAYWLRRLGVYANTDAADREFDRAYRDEAVSKIEWSHA